MPKLSIVMSAYNEEKYINQAVDSILNQTFTDFEFIIIDDGSSDDTLSILQSYTDKRLNIISRPNKGLSASIAEGIDLCKGTYVARMDADDISKPTRLQKQIEFMDNNPNYVALGCVLEQTDENGNLIRYWDAPARTESKLTLFSHTFPKLAHGCVMMRKDALDKIKGYRSYFYGSEEGDLFWQLDEVGAMGNLQEPLYVYRMNEGSMSLDLNIWRRVMSDETAAYCSRLRRSGKSDAIFDNPQLSRKDGYLLHKTDLSALEIGISLWRIAFTSVKFFVKLVIWKILTKLGISLS